MGKIRILAVEDDPIQKELLRISIETIGYHLIDIVDNGVAALQLVRITKPDLILMDIQIFGKSDGIELARKINQTSPTPIIFATSFTDSKTIQRAKMTEPYGYLLKPFQETELQVAIEMAVYRFQMDQDRQKEIHLNSNFSWVEDLLIKDSFFTKQGGRLIKIPFQEVLWIEVEKDRYCKVVTQQEELRLRMSLKEIATKLPPDRFIRIHRAYIINTAHIHSIDQHDNIIQVQKAELPLGRSYKEQILKKLNVL